MLNREKLSIITEVITEICFLLIIPASLFNKHVVKYSFVLGSIFLFVTCLINESKRKVLFTLFKNNLVKAWLLFLSITFISVIFSRFFHNSLEVFFQRYVIYFIFFVIGAYLARKRFYLKLFIAVFMLFSFIVSLGGIFDIIRLHDYNRLFTTFNKKILFADYLSLAFPFFLNLLILKKKSLHKILGAIGNLVVFICLFFVYSRAIFLSLVLSYIIILFVIKPKYKKIIIVVISVISMIVIILPAPREKKEMLLSMNTFSISQWGDRLPMWETALKMFIDSPIFGIGLGSYEKYVYKYPTMQDFIDKTNHLHAHSTYLEILSETGIFGFLSFICFLIYYLYMIFKRLKNEKINFFNLSFSVSIISRLIQDLISSNILVGIGFASLFWMISGLNIGRE